jgi:hypothetical protein
LPGSSCWAVDVAPESLEVVQADECLCSASAALPHAAHAVHTAPALCLTVLVHSVVIAGCYARTFLAHTAPTPQHSTILRIGTESASKCSAPPARKASA